MSRKPPYGLPMKNNFDFLIGSLAQRQVVDDCPMR
jgi:hypothetical protein